jgi:hypothetical protein
VKFKLQRVHYMPKELEPGVLYVSEEFNVAGHLCACGCGNKVITPLGQLGWSFEERDGLPTLNPSIGSWQLPCQSHYLIQRGDVRWAEKWTPAQIEAGRRAEEARAHAYYEALERQRRWQWLKAPWRWFKGLFSR